MSLLQDIRAARRQPATLAIAHHRPWPLPAGPWVMGQTWHDLLFAHWPVEPDALRGVVPAALPIDTWEGSAWITVSPFGIRGAHVRGTPPPPALAAFPELNVRTYCTIDGKPGIYFLSLDAGSAAAVYAARRLYRQPYWRASMRIHGAGTDQVTYDSRRLHGPRADLRVTYGPTGPARAAAQGTLDWWLAERYCLWIVDEDQRVLCGEIHHPPWPLQPAEAVFARNTMAEQVGLGLEGEPALHFARRQDVVFWLNRRIDRG